jgi:hypothetical protein
MEYMAIVVVNACEQQGIDDTDNDELEALFELLVEEGIILRITTNWTFLERPWLEKIPARLVPLRICLPVVIVRCG